VGEVDYRLCLKAPHPAFPPGAAAVTYYMVHKAGRQSGTLELKTDFHFVIKLTFVPPCVYGTVFKS